MSSPVAMLVGTRSTGRSSLTPSCAAATGGVMLSEHGVGGVPGTDTDPRGEPQLTVDIGPSGDVGTNGADATIASKAAMFLAEAGADAGEAGADAVSEGPPTEATAQEADEATTEVSPTEAAAQEAGDAVTAALRRVGLDEGTLRQVTEGLRHGGGLEALLFEAFGRVAPAPSPPRRPGSLLVVAGALDAARRLATAVAGEIGTDPAEIPVASRQGDPGHGSALLVHSAEDAAELAPGWRRSHAAVVVVDVAVTGSDRAWATHLISSLRPTAVWGVVDATCKTEDIAAWASTLGGMDALALENLGDTVSPAAALGAGIPVARLDGQLAHAARWTAIIVDRITPCT